MKKLTQKILFALTAILLFVSMSQKQFNFPKFRALKGVVVDEPMPKLTFQSYCDGEFQQKTEQHLKQHFGFRPPLIRLYNQYLWDFFKKTPVSKGILSFGKDGWLYEPWVVADYYQNQFRNYASDTAEMTAMFTEEAERLLQVQQALEPYGTYLFACVVPSKDRIYPEYLPDDKDYWFDSMPKTSARFINEREYARLGVNHLNLEHYFMQMKDTADFLLFPQTGTHWSNYASLFAADTLIRYMEHLGGMNIQNLVIGPRSLDDARDPDDDLEKLLNLIRPLPKPQYYYAKATADNDSTAVKPKVIVIGDSFWWNIANQIPLSKIFSSSPYWYYNSTVYFDGTEHSVKDLDLINEILSADFIILFYSATQQYKMNNGFTQDALEAIQHFKEVFVMDSLAFIEYEIEKTIAEIKTKPNLMEEIQEKATLKGKTFEQAIYDDAAWIVNYKIEQGTLKWPPEKITKNTKSNKYGIQ